MPDLLPVLVTGGAGYVGSHVCKLLHQNGFLPITYDDLSTGHKKAVRWGPFIKGDIADGAKLDEVFEEYQPLAVLHFAAKAYIGESMLMPAEYYRINVAGTLSLLEAMRRARIMKMVFSSSCATYGIPARQPITEEEIQAPINPYGQTKLTVEKMLQDYAVAYQFSSAILRYFNAAGADPDGEIGEDHDPEPHLIPNVLKALSGGEPLVIHGADYPTTDGTCVRDYIHVNDLATAHVAALRSLLEGEPSFACNLGTGRGISVLEIMTAVEKITGKSVPHSFGPRRPGDPAELVALTAKAHDLLGWKPLHSDLETIIQTAWQWHQYQLANQS
ncbi:UDP-glucose 4-epimerase GalE [Kiloniella laminariae]|uniref:UDP-glucose 4-epimerase n=1 Tax=Kiloniella laminariae TaxID=454162 RepID=A0ABT4LEJ7_9PROT|nr:UDP-glucose 4-epimerase GalE [Kiloniella laminariae]MCZ4279518.1 UDP-glucose 4-epimerase GalE [Kiloniella laminariae]